ncbi:MAG: hypothetical protein WDN69_31620 [Aliidongia sp.]
MPCSSWSIATSRRSADRMASAIAREREIPAVLAAGKAQSPASAARLHRDRHPQSRRLDRLLSQRCTPAAFAAVDDPELKRDFAASNDAAVAAFEDYRSFLQGRAGQGRMAASPLGPDIYVQRLAD